jgi:hypothetical protein
LFVCIYRLGLAIVKPYTVVNRLNNERNSSSEQTIELLIKHYTDGMLTPILQKLNIGKINKYISMIEDILICLKVIQLK